MNTMTSMRRIRRTSCLGFAAVLVASVSVLGIALGAANTAGAVTKPSVQGQACVTRDSATEACQDTITGSGFPWGTLLNVFVFRQSPALTGAGAGGGKNELTTQVATTLGIAGKNGEPGGTFSLSFDNPDAASCPAFTFTIEAQEVSAPDVWATATYSGQRACLE